MAQHVTISPTRFTYPQYLSVMPFLRRCSAAYTSPYRKNKTQVRYGIVGNYYTGYYPVAFSFEPGFVPTVVTPVGKELRYVSEEEFFAHHEPPEANIGLVAKTNLAGTAHTSGALMFEPLGFFSLKRLIAWRMLERMFQNNNPHSPIRSVIENGLCYDCEVIFDEITLALRLSFCFRKPTGFDPIADCVAASLRHPDWIADSLAGTKAGMVLNLRFQPPHFRGTALLPYRLMEPRCTWDTLLAEIQNMTAEALCAELYSTDCSLDFV